MLPELIFDDELKDIQTDFLFNDKLRIGTFYKQNSKSYLLCACLGHDNFPIRGYDEDGKLSEILTTCIRCNVETIEKFNSCNVVINTLRN